ncbi:helix-turn-helix domain-containing protein [Epibacterium sp. SM1979]|uniref:Helix-turn-helix domain-containing protein n=1 Tax=Tritonibacter litoralis TaxID=2662264 RepID=A0A843YG23_9RHOB|nr:AraC family transcriptional regulator [Tritonibacter litoralis]MQQ10450.1 helix-turn-helix domain-containing protein [Tritonibacter litoralis]
MKDRENRQAEPAVIAEKAQSIHARNMEKRLLRVVEHIHSAQPQELSLDHLADIAAMSRFHFHRVFHAVTGETAAQATRRIRLYRAAMQLVQGSCPIDQIAAEAGYATVPAFSRAFRARFDLPPGQFRQRGQLGPAPRPPLIGETKMYDVTLETLPDRRLAGLDHRGDYMAIGETFEKLNVLASSRNLWPKVQGMLGIYYDDPDATPAQDLRSFAALEIAADADVAEPMERASISGGATAVLLFKGPYAGLHDAYKYLYGVWLPQSGREARDAPCYEVYLNSPSDTAPEELLTQICLPLAA